MATNNDIVETALSFVGKLKYSFGSDNIENGTGDCSAFTEYVFKKNGINIGSNSETQYSKGIQIQRGYEQPGDLIFFKDTYKSGYKDGVSHVGIVTEKGKFVDLGNSGCSVKSMDSNYYDSHFLAIKRVTDVSYGNIAENQNTTSTTKSNIGLTWWGDIVKVVVIIIILVAGVTLLATSFGSNILKNKGVF